MNFSDIFFATLGSSLLATLISKTFDFFQETKKNNLLLKSKFFERKLCTMEDYSKYVAATINVFNELKDFFNHISNDRENIVLNSNAYERLILKLKAIDKMDESPPALGIYLKLNENFKRPTLIFNEFYETIEKLHIEMEQENFEETQGLAKKMEGLIDKIIKYYELQQDFIRENIIKYNK